MWEHGGPEIVWGDTGKAKSRPGRILARTVVVEPGSEGGQDVSGAEMASSGQATGQD